MKLEFAAECRDNVIIISIWLFSMDNAFLIQFNEI